MSLIHSDKTDHELLIEKARILRRLATIDVILEARRLDSRAPDRPNSNGVASDWAAPCRSTE